MEHTKGPWIIEEYQSDVHELKLGILSPDDFQVCAVTRIYNLAHGPGEIPDHANAQLIAAAPELLKETKDNEIFFNEIAVWLHDIKDQDFRKRLADRAIKTMAAIAKAEGK